MLLAENKKGHSIERPYRILFLSHYSVNTALYPYIIMPACPSS